MSKHKRKLREARAPHLLDGTDTARAFEAYRDAAKEDGHE